MASNPFAFLTGGNMPAPPQQIPLDAGAQGILNADAAKASGSSDEFTKGINQGVSEGAYGLQGSASQAQKDAGYGGANPYGEALSRAYSSKATGAVSRLKEQNRYNGQIEQANLSHQMSTALLGQQQALTQQYEMLSQVQQQSDAARAAFVNQLFQTADQGMAMYAGNRKNKHQGFQFNNGTAPSGQMALDDNEMTA